MRDAAHEWTSEEIKALEERIRVFYREAAADAQAKLDAFTAKFKRDEEMVKKQLEAGEITKATYRDWLAGQMFQDRRWRAMLADLTATMTHANELAMQIVNEETPKAFAYNANWAAFQLEKSANANMGFGLYDQDTVTRLLRDQPTLLPPSRVDIPKDQRWNMQKITWQINQGIVQGEGLDAIAKRLQNVAEMNFNSARTHARTAMTGAQNAGRMETYRRAQAMDIEMEKEWLSTLDTHTRHSHQVLDGQRKPVDEPFDSPLGAIMYPGDRSAKPANTYNCRCTLISHLIDYPAQNAQRRDDDPRRKPISDMTFAEWAKMKAEEAEEEKKRAEEKKKEKAESAKKPKTTAGKKKAVQIGWAEYERTRAESAKGLQSDDGAGIIKPEDAQFAGKRDLAWHFDKHKTEYPDITESEYLQKARTLLKKPLEQGSVEEITRSDGSVSRYDFKENDFVSTTPDGNIRTFFKPDEKSKYWSNEHERNK